jgi:hypothetical protein
MLKHPLECVVTLMSSDIVHPLFSNLNLQWLVTKNTQRDCPRNMFLFDMSLHAITFFYIYLDLHVSILFFFLS